MSGGNGTSIALGINGADIVIDHSGAMFWPAMGLLAVADLHLEKGSSFAQRGSHLPPYDTRATITRLAEVATRYHPRHVICVGDSFHDGEAADRLADSDAADLRRLTNRCDWTWICGNHDVRPPTDWGGRIADDVVVGPLVFRHEARPRAGAGEVSGHFHPKAGFSVRGRYVSGRCFVSDGRRLILPAFGAYAGGLDVRDPAITSLFPDGCRICLIGRSRLHSMQCSVSVFAGEG